METTIKKQRIYHCKTQECIKQFLTKTKLLGFVWKNDLEINPDDAEDIFNAFGENTCFKTNMGKISIGSFQGYKAKEPDREITEFIERELPKEIYVVRNINEMAQTVVYLKRNGKRLYSHGIELTIQDAINIYRNERVFGSYVAVMNDDCIKFIQPSSLSELGIDRSTLKPYISVGDYTPKQYDVAKVVDTGELVIVSSVYGSSYEAFCMTFGGLYNSYLFCELEKVEIQKTDEVKKIKDGDCFRIGNNLLHASRCLDGIILATTLEYGFVYQQHGGFSINGSLAFLVDNKEIVVDDDVCCPFNVDDILVRNNTNQYFKVAQCQKYRMVVLDANGASSYIYYNHYNDFSKAKIASAKHGKMLAVSDEKLHDLCKKARKVFETHGYTKTTHDAVMKWLKKWNENKGWIVNELRKCKGWDEDNLCVYEVVDQKRVNSPSQKQQALTTFLDNMMEYYDYERRALKSNTIYDSIVSGKLLEDARKRILQEETFANVKINVGEKMTRVIRKLCSAMGIDKESDFEKEYAKLCDGICDGVQKIAYCLSANPLDFLLMSNGNSWTSCHYLEYGNDAKCYQSGTMSYPVDEVSMIFFAVKKEENKNDLYLKDKCKRQIVCYDGRTLLQSRLYPDVSNYGTYIESINDFIREWIVSKLDEGTTHDWEQVKKDVNSTFVKRYFLTAPGATHYPDYNYDYYHINVVRSCEDKDINPFDRYEIGGRTICPKCGQEHSRSVCCYCYDC